MSERRRFRPLGVVHGSPTLESMIRREPSRRIFRQLSSGSANTPLPIVYSDWSRLITLDSILSSDTTVADYTTAWTYHPSSGDYQIVVTGSPTTEGATNPQDRWVRKMQPIRYRIYSPVFSGPSNAVYTSGSYIGLRNTSVPYAGHTKGESMREVDIRGPFYSQMNTVESKLAYLRVRVNSVDITGAVAVDARLTAIGSLGYRTCQMLTNFDLGNTASSDNLVELDCWFYLSFTRSECGSQLQPDSLNPFTLPWHLRAYSVPPSTSYAPVFTGINCQARIGRSDVFKITWGSNAPGGTSPLTLTPQSGWDFEQISETSVLMTKNTAPSSGEKVFFNWGREIPEVIATRSVSMPSGLYPVGRYTPTNSGHYVAPLMSKAADGIWEPASTVFPAMGFRTTSGNPVWGANTNPSIATNMPQTCTVERV